MQWILQNWWLLFIAALVIFLVTGVWLNKLAQKFFIEPGGIKFNIMDLELPASETSFYNLIGAMNEKVKTAVRRHLWVDFLFMAGAYPGIALLCLKASAKMEYAGKWIFLALAVLQIISWLFDILENRFLLRRVNKPVTLLPPPIEEGSKSFRSYQFVVKTKFVIALTAAVCSLFGLLYFWIVGNFSKEALPWLGVVVLLVLVATFVNKAQQPKGATA